MTEPNLRLLGQRGHADEPSRLEESGPERVASGPMKGRVTTGNDGRTRCWWCGDDSEYVRYHDEEWGRPLHGEAKVLEKLCLEGAQAGLSWITILRKRDRYREVFAHFDPPTVASYTNADVERLLTDAGIVRNRGKIESAIGNAQATVAMLDRGESLDALCWSFQPPMSGNPRSSDDELVTVCPESVALSKELKRRGFRFVGPTTMYAFMQSAGLINDHSDGCWVQHRL